MSYQEAISGRGYPGGMDDRPSHPVAPSVSKDAENLAAFIDTDPIRAFAEITERVSLFPEQMFVNTAPVNLSLGSIKRGEPLGSVTLKIKLHSDSLGQVHDFDGDLAEAAALAKGIKRGVFDAQVRIAYRGSGMPLDIGLSWESFDLLNQRRHVDAGHKEISGKLLVALLTSMQTDDPLKQNPPQATVDSYSRRSDEYRQPDRKKPFKLGNPAGADNAKAVELVFKRLEAERERSGQQQAPQPRGGRKKNR